MTFKKFEEKDILYNVLETNPEQTFKIYNSKVYHNNQTEISGAFVDPVLLVPTGFVSLLEINVDRNETDTGLIYPFVTKDGSLIGTKTISTTTFNTDFSYGDTISGSYPLSASLKRDFYHLDEPRPEVEALKNTLNYYVTLSRHYQYNSSFGNKGTLPLNLISIPSILYGDSIKKGSLELNFYVSGTLIGSLSDERRNGELVQTGPSGSTGSGSVAGVVLYTEGFVLLTGSWALSTHTEDYDPTVLGPEIPSWLYYCAGTNDGIPAGTILSSSYSFDMKGVNKIPTLTMFAHANKIEMNHSNNSTYVEYGQSATPLTGAYLYSENKNLQIKNIVSSSYADPTGSFEKITYISQVGIYDEDKNLIGIATVANPVKKTQSREFTFKLKLDI